MQYQVLVPCRNDETGRAFQPGEAVTADDFPAAVIENWLEIGVLAPRAADPEGGPAAGPKRTRRKKVTDGGR